ncbi:hypothetical protein DOY81_000435 [Sarcophaga bullata]|nr:hypothetical protein DOY81_000435 [Sarcophaga bullata]
MGNAPLKVTYHQDTKKINKYFNIVFVYQEIYDKILENGPFCGCSKPLVMRLFWIDVARDEIRLESQEDLDIFIARTASLNVRHIHAKLVQPDEYTNRSKFSA